MSEEVKKPKPTIVGGIYLSPEVSKIYRSYKSLLKRERGFYSSSDDAAVALLATQIDDLNKCTIELEEWGSSVIESDSRDGTSRKAHPAANTKKELNTQIRLSLIELGMTPRVKKQMAIEAAQKQENAVADLLKTLND